MGRNSPNTVKSIVVAAFKPKCIGKPETNSVILTATHNQRHAWMKNDCSYALRVSFEGGNASLVLVVPYSHSDVICTSHQVWLICTSLKINCVDSLFMYLQSAARHSAGDIPDLDDPF